MKRTSAIRAAAVLIASLITGATASATGIRKYHVSSCQFAGTSGSVVWNTSGQLGNLTGSAQSVWCPLAVAPPVDLPATSKDVRIHGFSLGSSGLSAKICATFPGGGGQTCGVPSVTGLSGVSTLIPFFPSAPAMASGDYPYVVVTLGPSVGGGSNTVFGYNLNVTTD
jgi:hypothetical protein